MTIYDGFLPFEIASQLWAVGRYYNGGDATFTSRVCPTTAGTGVDSLRRISRIAWTGFVPEEVPGGRLRARVQVGSEWTDWLDEPTGSRVDLPVTGPVRYQIAFEESAAEGSEPLVASPDLDDVTIFFTIPPVLTRWDYNLPPEQVLQLVEPPAEANEPEPPLPVEEITFPGGQAPPPPPLPQQPPGGQGSAGAQMGLPGPVAGGGGGARIPPPSANVSGRGVGGAKGGSGGGAVHVPHRGENASLKAKDRPPRSRVVIEVVDAQTGNPVPRALVTIAWNGKVYADHVHSNARGRLLLTAAQGIEYELTVEREGYESVTRPFGVEDADVVVEVLLEPDGK